MAGLRAVQAQEPWERKRDLKTLPNWVVYSHPAHSQNWRAGQAKKQKFISRGQWYVKLSRGKYSIVDSLNTWEFRDRCLRPTSGHPMQGTSEAPPGLGLRSCGFQTWLNFPTIFVTLRKGLPLSGIQFPPLQSGAMISPPLHTNESIFHTQHKE